MCVLPPFSRCILPVVPTRGDKATATMADIKSEAEMQCPEELPEYTSAAPTIRTDSVEADPQNSEETRSVREMEEGVPKGNKAITDTFDEDLMDCCFLTATALMGVGVFAFAIGMLYLMLERRG